MKYLLSTFLFLFVNELTGQSISVDSLESVLKNSKNEIEKINVLNTLFTEYEFIDLQKAGQYADLALQLSLKNKYDQGLAASYTHKAYLAEDTGNYKQAINYYEKSIQLYSTLCLKNADEIKYKKSLSTVVGNMGNAYHREGNYPKTLEYYFFALRIDEVTGEKENLSTQISNIGTVYYELNEFDKAIGYINRAVKLDEETGNNEGMARNLGNLSNIYILQKKYPDAILNLERALKLAGLNGNKSNISAWLGNLGQAYEGMSETLFKTNKIINSDSLLEIALNYHHRAFDLAMESGDKKAITTKYANLGFLFFKLGKRNKEISMKSENLSKAEESLKKALDLSNELGLLKEARSVEEYLADLYSHTGNFKDAFIHYKNFVLLRDSVYNESNMKRTIVAEVNFDYEKKKAVEDAKHDAELKRKEDLAKADKKRQQLIIISVSTGLIFIVIFFIILFNRFRIIRKQKNIIQNQKELVDEKNKEILDSINYARRLQEAILPPQKLVKEYLTDSFILYKPKDIVAGDFYWMETIQSSASSSQPAVGSQQLTANSRIQEKQQTADRELPTADCQLILFAAADCTGHGVPGAMVSVVCSNALNRTVKEFGITVAGEILNKVRELVMETFAKSESEVKDGMDISLCVLDLSKKELLWSGANNPLWIIRKNKNEIEEIKPDKQPIGRYADPHPFTTHNISLTSGDSIYIFTDGFADQFGGEKGKKFKASGMKELFLSIKNQPMENQRVLINNAFEKWKGSLEQIDDVCVIGVKIQ